MLLSRHRAIVGMIGAAFVLGGCSQGQGSPSAVSSPSQAATSDVPSPSEAAGADCESVEFNFATDQAPAALQAGQSVQRWADGVEAATSGRVSVAVHFSESLTTQAEILDSMAAGVAEVAAVSMNRFPAEFPLWTELGTTHDLDLTLAVGPREQVEVTRQLMEEFPELTGELENRGLRLLTLLTSGPHVLMTREPATTLEDLSGKKIRTYGTGIPLLFEAAGAVPVSVPASEIYTSTQAAALDGAFTIADFLESLSYDELAPNITIIGENGSTPMVNIGFAFLIGDDAWAELCPDDQQAVTDVSLEVENWLADATIARHEEAIEEMVARGAEVHEFDDASLEEWRAQMPDFLAISAENLNGKALPGDDFVAEVERIATEAGAAD